MPVVGGWCGGTQHLPRSQLIVGRICGHGHEICDVDNGGDIGVGGIGVVGGVVNVLVVVVVDMIDGVGGAFRARWPDGDWAWWWCCYHCCCWW